MGLIGGKMFLREQELDDKVRALEIKLAYLEGVLYMLLVSLPVFVFLILRTIFTPFYPQPFSENVTKGYKLAESKRYYKNLTKVYVWYANGLGKTLNLPFDFGMSIRAGGMPRN